MTTPDRLQGLFHYYPESESIRLMIAGREISFRRYGDDIWSKLELIMEEGLPPLPEAKAPLKCKYCQGIVPDQCVCPAPPAKRYDARGRPLLDINIDDIFGGYI